MGFVPFRHIRDDFDDFGKAQELHRQVRHLTEECLALPCGPSRGHERVIVIRFIRP